MRLKVRKLFGLIICKTILAPKERTQQKCGIIGTKKPTQKEAADMGRRSEYTREEKVAAVKLVTEEGRSVLSCGGKEV